MSFHGLHTSLISGIHRRVIPITGGTTLCKAMSDTSLASYSPLSSVATPTPKCPFRTETDHKTAVFFYPPDVPVTRNERGEKPAVHSAAKRNHESLFPMGEDLHFSQWMILTGRIFDPHSFPRPAGLPEEATSDPLQHYFSSPCCHGVPRGATGSVLDNWQTRQESRTDTNGTKINGFYYAFPCLSHSKNFKKTTGLS